MKFKALITLECSVKTVGLPFSKVMHLHGNISETITVYTEMRDVENAAVPIAWPQVGSIDAGAATIVRMCRDPVCMSLFSKAKFRCISASCLHRKV